MQTGEALGGFGAGMSTGSSRGQAEATSTVHAVPGHRGAPGPLPDSCTVVEHHSVRTCRHRLCNIPTIVMFRQSLTRALRIYLTDKY